MFLRIFSAVLQPRAAAKLLFSRVNSVRVQNASHNLERNQNKGTDAELEWGGGGFQEVWSFTKMCKFIPRTKQRSGKNKPVKLLNFGADG